MAAPAVLKAAPAPILAANPVNSRPSTAQDNSTKPLGPASKVYTIPPRARPGRRPISGDDSSDRRKLQNRESQRAYRDRRADRVKELEQNLENTAKLHRDASTAWMVEKHQLQSELHSCRAQLQTLKTRFEALDAEHRNLLSARDQQSATLRSPPEEPQFKKQKTSHDATSTMPSPVSHTDDMEIDFTNMFSSRPAAPSTATLNAIEPEDNCGFCTDDQNCACRETFATAAREEAEEAARAAAKAAQAQKKKLQSLAPGPVSGPGTCDQCRADPERARQCQELARFARIEPRPPANTTATSTPTTASGRQTRSSASASASANPQHSVRLPPITVSCADFLGQIPRPRHPDHNSTAASASTASPYGEMFGRLRAYPYFRPLDAGSGSMSGERSSTAYAADQDGRVAVPSQAAEQPERHLPAFSIDAAEAAVVLASLSKTEVKK